MVSLSIVGWCMGIMTNKNIATITLYGLVGALLSLLSPGETCTEFNVRSEDGSSTVGRLMEFDIPVKSQFSSEDRGAKYYSYLNNIHNHNCIYAAATWTSLYKVLLVRPVGEDIKYAAIDGINEFGLTASALYLHGTQYENVCDEHCHEVIPQGQFIPYVLSQYRTVNELVSSMKEGTFPCVVGNIDLGIVHPVHFGVTDADGAGVVVEYIRGKRIVHNNTLGVLTNAPTYDRHMQNAHEVFHFKENSTIPTGRNWRKPLSGRFLKTTDFLHSPSYVRPKTKENAILKAFHILDIVSSIKSKTWHSVHYTYWVIVKDLSQRCIYYKTYRYISLRMLCMDDIPHNGLLPLDHEEDFMPSVEDMSDKMEAKEL